MWLFFIKKMNFLSEEISLYAEKHTTKEPQILRELNRDTWSKVMNPRMLSDAIHGDLSQAQRDHVMQRLREKKQNQ